jgi:16S rRNA (adenine1518-N6/adenine1519-N6)-dimethyltransferase
MEQAKKSLGQHWLTDIEALEAIAEHAEIKHSDTVLEIGPGLGNLTRYLVRQARHVIAVEYDEKLAKKLPSQLPAKNLSVVQADIRKFDLSSLPSHYKVVANIPYYLTSNLIKTLSEASNPPAVMVLLVQQEVAERLCAKPGQMSLLAVSAQLYYDCELGAHVPADKFDPPPKVDSQAVILTRHTKPIFSSLDTKLFFKIVKAGFSEKRKKLRSSLAGGLGMSKDEVDKWLKQAGIDAELRAQNLSLKDWHKLYKTFNA